MTVWGPPKANTAALEKELAKWREVAGQLAALVPVWQPIETAPKDGTYIILAAPSGYTGTPLRVEVCKYDAEYRPLQPWVNHSNDSFTDGGVEPTHWMPLPPQEQPAALAAFKALMGEG